MSEALKNLVKKKVDGFNWILDVADGGIGSVLARANTTGVDSDFAREKLFMLTLNTVVEPGMVCVDVGANIGYATMMMIRNSGDVKNVHAIEPDSHNLKCLKRNLKLNNYDGCIVTKCLMSDYNGESEFWIARHPNLNSVAKTRHSTRKENIPCMTIGKYCESRRIYPNFIKMDIEGHETKVFEGAYEFFKNNQGKTSILLEVHPKMYDDGNNFAKVLKEYESIGFKITSMIATPVSNPEPLFKLGYKPDIEVPSDGWVRSIYTGIKNEDAIRLCTNLHSTVPGGKCVRSILVSREA